MPTLPRPRLWPLLFGLAFPACLDLPKMDPGVRVVDDFTSGDLKPTWSRFGPWSCDTFTGSPPVGPVDAGAGDGSAEDGGLEDGGLEDGGAAGDKVSCSFDLVTGQPALRADFQLVDPPSDLSHAPGAEVVIRVMAGTVNLTAFTKLAFFAYTEETLALPSAALLSVGLGCASFAGYPLASNTVTFSSLMTGGFPTDPSTPSLAEFKNKNIETCLAQVDSIHFAILPNNADGKTVAGTLHITNISLN